jgi:hypothetical protein
MAQAKDASIIEERKKKRKSWELKCRRKTEHHQSIEKRKIRNKYFDLEDGKIKSGEWIELLLPLKLAF